MAVELTHQVLNALHTVKWYQDGTLTLRRSCAHGVCRSDPVQIDGRNRLACQVLVKHLGPVITLEPMRGFWVIKDLLGETEALFAQCQVVKPCLISDEMLPGTE